MYLIQRTAQPGVVDVVSGRDTKEMFGRAWGSKRGRALREADLEALEVLEVEADKGGAVASAGLNSDEPVREWCCWLCCCCCA